MPKLRVMISSRCNDPFPRTAGQPLSDVRQRLKDELEAVELLNHQLFEVWINEDAPPTPGSDGWDVCMAEVDKSDILIVLFNGNAGWAASAGGTGICHGEFERGLGRAPGKVRVLQLGERADIESHTAPRDKRFQEVVRKADQFRGAAAKTEDELVSLAKETVVHAVSDLAKLGVRESRRGQYHLGEALEWSKLDYRARCDRIVETLVAALVENGGNKVRDDLVTSGLANSPVLIQVHAVPGRMTEPTARELVGRPFLADHQLLREMASSDGPIHVIGCNRGATETQARDLLGFPDAVIVRAPFGVYVADEVQKIQFMLLENCRDETTTRTQLQRCFDWLDQSGEAKAAAARAKARKRIIQTIAAVA